MSLAAVADLKAAPATPFVVALPLKVLNFVIYRIIDFR